ncbi:hypothetical protein OBBRIDRAFT_801092 [Obba rivulosa]|uniref:Uncharacterized protein n=1 Tax=Obba rivulosa TaxID=1052685 RepID=A0A8E2DRU2_9APHY|nr:hypothetical protein OBBRIDRAFT_801092 [Obba rivulosa]
MPMVDMPPRPHFRYPAKRCRSSNPCARHTSPPTSSWGSPIASGVEALMAESNSFRCHNLSPEGNLILWRSREFLRNGRLGHGALVHTHHQRAGNTKGQEGAIHGEDCGARCMVLSRTPLVRTSIAKWSGPSAAPLVPRCQRLRFMQAAIPSD